MQDFNEAVQACEAEPEPCEAESEPALDAMMDLVERMHKEIMEMQSRTIKIRQALQNVTIEL